MLIALPRLDNKKDCDSCQTVLNELENIDDDTDRQGISFIKTQVHIIKLMHVTMIELIFFSYDQDLDMATNFGVTHFPALIYFENQVPSIYEGQLSLFNMIRMVPYFFVKYLAIA